MTQGDLTLAGWRKSSYSSQTACVEVATDASWRKSIRSNDGGACVEVARNLPDVVAVRDSKHPDGAMLVVSRAAWTAFLHELKGQPAG